MLLVAAVVSVSANSPHMSPWIQAIITSQRCVRIIQVGMVMFLLFFGQYVGVSRKQHSFGIALGFGTFAMIELILICSWVGNHLGDPWMSIINMTAYNASLTMWLTYVAVKRPIRDVSRSLLQPQRWEQSLSDIHHPLPADSLIPMFEGMVDRRSLAHGKPQPCSHALAESAAAGAADELRGPEASRPVVALPSKSIISTRPNQHVAPYPLPILSVSSVRIL